MTTFVLLHGAWHGGWCWGRVKPILEGHGHEVFATTLTGLSDRAHLISPSIGLHTHVEDVVRLIEAHDLKEIVLVGHSYSGMIVSAVASQVPDRIAHRVYLDAFLPNDGEAAIDLLPETVAQHYREAVANAGFGWLIPPRPLKALGITEPSDIDWLQPRLTSQPWLTYTQPITIAPATEDVPGTFIEAVNWMRVFRPHAERARRRGWVVLEVDCGHEVMVTSPKTLAGLLHSLTPVPASPFRQPAGSAAGA